MSCAEEPRANDDHRDEAVTCTVSHERSGDRRTIVVADTESGQRCVATTVDPPVAQRAETEELIGTRITVTGPEFSIEPT
jgi:hypothetical protein